MGICGLLAYESVLNGNKPIKIPNLRNKEERDAYRNNTACCNEKFAEGQLWPSYSKGEIDIPDSAYDYTKRLYEDGKPG